MRTDPITPWIYSGLKSVTVLPADNISRPYLYNEVLNIANELKVPANFHTSKIEFPEPIKAVIAKLKELGICYKEVE